MWDSPQTSIYRVTVSGYDSRTRECFLARVNVKASSPTMAVRWLLTYPYDARLPLHTSMQVTAAYKLRRQPVWLKKVGHNHYRFDIRELYRWTAAPNTS
jgi:hypothetical protein